MYSQAANVPVDLVTAAQLLVYIVILCLHMASLVMLPAQPMHPHYFWCTKNHSCFEAEYSPSFSQQGTLLSGYLHVRGPQRTSGLLHSWTWYGFRPSLAHALPLSLIGSARLLGTPIVYPLDHAASAIFNHSSLCCRSQDSSRLSRSIQGMIIWRSSFKIYTSD